MCSLIICRDTEETSHFSARRSFIEIHNSRYKEVINFHFLNTHNKEPKKAIGIATKIPAK